MLICCLNLFAKKLCIRGLGIKVRTLVLVCCLRHHISIMTNTECSQYLSQNFIRLFVTTMTLHIISQGAFRGQDCYYMLSVLASNVSPFRGDPILLLSYEM